MPLVLTSGPSTEPVSLDDMKSFLRVDSTEEDNLISTLITAGRVHIEQTINHRLIQQQWSWYLDQWPKEEELQIPCSPLMSVGDVNIYDDQGTATPWLSTNYLVDAYSFPARLIRKAPSWPVPGLSVNGIEIQLVLGYGTSSESVPEPIRQALRMLVAYWFENREPVALGETVVYTPETVLGLLAPYQAARL